MQKIKIIYNGREIEAEIDENNLNKLETENKRWRAVDGENFWTITNRGGILKTCDGNEDCYKIGNMYKTKEEAQNVFDKRVSLQKIKDYIVENGLSFEPDWENREQEKFLPSFNIKEKEFFCCKIAIARSYSPFGYLKSEEDCEKLIKDCYKELMRL